MEIVNFFYPLLTFEKFILFPDNYIFIKGTFINDTNGIYFFNDNNKKTILKYVAVTGTFHDWCIYIGTSEKSDSYICSFGDKLKTLEYIKKLVKCDYQTLMNYRY